MSARNNRVLRPWVAALAAATVPVGLIGRGEGLAGYALGLGATAFSVWGLWRVVCLTGSAAEAGAPSRLGTTAVVLAFLVKLPVFILAGLAANRIGGAAPPCFLLGLAGVYFALVAWALANS